MDPRRALVQRADYETPRLNDQLADSGVRTRGPVRAGAERLRRRRPGELDQLGRSVGHLDQPVAEALLEPELAQQPDHRPETVGKLLQDEAHRVGAVAQGQQHRSLLDGDEADVAEVRPNRPAGTHLERQTDRIDAHGGRLGDGARPDQPALAVDLDRLELPAALFASGVAARLGAHVAGIATPDPQPARIAGVVALEPAQTERAGQPLELPRPETAHSHPAAHPHRAAGSADRSELRIGPVPHAARNARTRAEPAAETATVVHAAIVASTRRLGGMKRQGETRRLPAGPRPRPGPDGRPSEWRPAAATHPNCLRLCASCCILPACSKSAIWRASGRGARPWREPWPMRSVCACSNRSPTESSR
jgi:hypothetical protein